MTLIVHDEDALSTVGCILSWNQRTEWKHLDHTKFAEQRM